MKKQIIFTSVVTALITSITTGAVVAQTTQRFPDVPTDAWYYSAVNNLNDWDVIRGNDDGTFNPNGQVNRAQLAVMWDRYDERVKSVSLGNLDLINLSASSSKIGESNQWIALARAAYVSSESCTIVDNYLQSAEQALIDSDRLMDQINDPSLGVGSTETPQQTIQTFKDLFTDCY